MQKWHTQTNIPHLNSFSSYNLSFCPSVNLNTGSRSGSSTPKGASDDPSGTPKQPSPPTAPAPYGGKTFAVRALNIMDPLLPTNNLGRSVSRANFLRMRRAFAHGAKVLEAILSMVRRLVLCVCLCVLVCACVRALDKHLFFLSILS